MSNEYYLRIKDESLKFMLLQIFLVEIKRFARSTKILIILRENGMEKWLMKYNMYLYQVLHSRF